MKLQGKLSQKMDTVNVTEKFKKREFVLLTDSNTKYPQHILMQVVQNNCDILDMYNQFDTIEVDFNIKGREFIGANGIKFYNTLEAWNIAKIEF